MKPEPTPEELDHAAFDLAQYTVNTSALYPKAQEIMRVIARQGKQPMLGNGPHPLWRGHAKKGRQSYETEMGYGDHTARFFIPAVLEEAARQIADHYAEEQAEVPRA